MTASRPVLWTAAEAAAATGGSVSGAWRATGVSIDTRTLAAGDLFIALKGPTFDGHDFVSAALERGASAAVVTTRPTDVSASAALLKVDDTFDALNALGRAARDRAAAKIIGVTGSVGKTGVKEGLRTVLSTVAPTVANVGSLNNHWGLPLSLTRMAPDAAFGVFEMGMNHSGEISPLSRLARPHVAVITTVEGVHRAHFDSVAAIADAKAEIFDGLEAGGVAVLNRDNPYFERLAAKASARGARLLSFGRHRDAVARVLDATETSGETRVSADIGGTSVTYRLTVAGAHWVTNSLCILAAVHAAGADVRAVAAAMAGVRPPKGRGERHQIAFPGGAFELIDDSYNASPVSMAASFQVLGAATPGRGGRRIAVLGDMLELGDEAAALHAGLVEPLKRHGIDVVFTAGPNMEHLAKALPGSMRGGHAADSEQLTPLVISAVRPSDVVAVKGSAGSRMGRIVEALRALEYDLHAAPRVVNGG